MVLFVSYSGELGGAERLLVRYASSLDCERVLACPDGPLAQAARATGVPVIARPARSLRLRGGLGEHVCAVARLTAHAREVRALASDLGAELIIAWGMRSALAAAPAKTPFLFAHNDLIPGPVVGAAVRAAARRAVAVVALSHASARELDAGAIVIHPGVDVGAFEAGDRPPDEPPTVLVLGALVEWKRPDLALEAVALARRRLPELRLVLAGAPIGGDTAVLQALRARAAAPDLASAVTFAGLHPDPRAALASAVCLLHCAEREPFGLAVLEALAAARPAIVPDACGPAEIVDEGCGILYPPGDAAAAADAIVRVASNPALAAGLGHRGRERAREHFDRPRAARRFAEVVAAAAGARDESPQPAGGQALSIVTVTHNSARPLRALLDSVSEHLPAAEVVVVDCASEDEGLEIAHSQDGVRVIALGDNVGFGRACNRGIAAATRPVVALLNPDVRLLDGSLDLLAGQALNAGAGERLLAPLVLNTDGSRQDTVHPAPGSPAELVRCLVAPAALPGRAGIRLAPWRAHDPCRVGWAVGCALVAQTQTFARLGPFHESLFLYGEDLELGLRASRAGIQTWFVPAARVVHERAHATAAAFGGEPFELLARGRHDAIALARGPLAAAADDCTQAVTFVSRAALKRVLGRCTARERRQFRALGSVAQGPGPLRSARR